MNHWLDVFMDDGPVKARYEWHERRQHGTRLERCIRLWAQIKEEQHATDDGT